MVLNQWYQPPPELPLWALGGGSAISEFLIALRKKNEKREKKEKAVGAGADVAEPPLTGDWTLDTHWARMRSRSRNRRQVATSIEYTMEDSTGSTIVAPIKQ